MTHAEIAETLGRAEGVEIAERVLHATPGIQGFQRTDLGEDSARLDVQLGEAQPEESG